MIPDSCFRTNPAAEPACAEDTAVSVIDLRALLRERFPGAHLGLKRPLAPAAAAGEGESLSGVPALDALGPPQGELTEVICPHPGHGGALLLHQLLRQAALRGQPLALVDGRDSFDPDSLCAQPERQGRLLWLRCHNAPESVRVADLLLRDGNLDLLLLDLQLNPAKDIARVPDSSWHRLRFLMRGTRRHCFVFTPRRTVPRAGLRVELGRALQIDAMDRLRADLLPLLQVQPLRQNNAIALESSRARHVG